MTVITGKEIQQYGYRTLADVLEAVRGFYITYDRYDSYVGVRGFGLLGDWNSRILLLIDGHRINDDILGQAFAAGNFGSYGGCAATYRRSYDKGAIFALSGTFYTSTGQRYFSPEFDRPTTNFGVTSNTNYKSYGEPPRIAASVVRRHSTARQCFPGPHG